MTDFLTLKNPSASIEDNIHTAQRVVVIDIDMPFSSMVGFMVKWAVASIPALLFIGAFAIIAAVIINVIGVALFGASPFGR